MKVATYEGIVENGQIKLSEELRLAEHAKVYVVVAGVEEVSGFRVGSPRLAQPDGAVTSSRRWSRSLMMPAYDD